MKRIATILFVISTVLPSLYSQTPYVSITTVDSAIDDTIVEEISILKDDFIRGIQNEDTNLLDTLWSDRLRETAGTGLDTFVEQVHSFLLGEDLSVDHMYHTKVVSPENPVHMTIIPEVTTDLPMINSCEIYGSQSFSFFLETSDDMNQYLLFLNFGKFQREWKILTVGVGNYKISKMSAPALYDKIHSLNSDIRDNAAVYYALALKTCLRPLYYLQYQNEETYIQTIESEIQAINDLYGFPFMLGDMQVIGLDIQLTDSEGITPVVKYITEVELNQANTDEEIASAWNEILGRFSGLDSEFEHIVFQGFNEMPIDPNQQYNCYNTVISLTDQRYR